MPTLQELCDRYQVPLSTKENGDLFLIHEGDDVKALAVREDMNARILGDPGEVWVGDYPEIARWGELFVGFAKARKRLALYVKRNGQQQYEHQGTVTVIHQTFDAHELELRRTKFDAPFPLSRIIFLAPPAP